MSIIQVRNCKIRGEKHFLFEGKCWKIVLDEPNRWLYIQHRIKPTRKWHWSTDDLELHPTHCPYCFHKRKTHLIPDEVKKQRTIIYQSLERIRV